VKKHSDGGKERRKDGMTLPPSASSSPASSSAAGQVAGGRPTSADFSPFPLPPFPFLYLLPALFIPLRPHTAQLAGVAVRSQSQPSPQPSPTSILPDIESVGRSPASEMGEQQPISIFYSRYLALKLGDGGEGLSFLIFRGQVGRTELCVCVDACWD